MFDIFKEKVYPDKFKSVQEKDEFIKDIKDKLSLMFSGTDFKILMVPQISKTNVTMKITEWKKDIGDSVRLNDTLASCETKKAQFDLSSTENGILIFKAEKGKDLMKDDIYAVLADKFVDLKNLNI